MKITFVFALLLITTSAIANVVKYNIDDVDMISSNEKSFLVEDLRDGFESINGVNVSKDIVSINTDVNLNIQFKSGIKINSRAMSAKLGGDMGGG